MRGFLLGNSQDGLVRGENDYKIERNPVMIPFAEIVT
jgi:hypothetical protein